MRTTWALPNAPANFKGMVGRVRGEIGPIASVAGLAPASLRAATLKKYSVPFKSPETTIPVVADFVCGCGVKVVPPLDETKMS